MKAAAGVRQRAFPARRRPQRPAQRRERRLATATLATAILATVLASGCSGTGPQLASVSPATQATAGAGGANSPGGLTLAPSPEEIAASGPSTPLNPFSDLTETAIGGREVIANPTLAEVLESATPLLPEMSFGRPDAPVVIVKYASLTCPYCRQFHADVFPRLKRTYIDTGKVRFILREFPIGRQSGQATVALRCAPAARYLDLYAAFLSQQGRWVSQEVRIDPIADVVRSFGLTRAAYDACRADPKLVEGLKLVKDRGRKLGIIGTPNFFIGNKLVKKALDWPALEAEVEKQLGGSSATAAVAGARGAQ